MKLSKWGIILKALLFVVPALVVKIIMHFSGLEYIAVGPIITALVAGVFFVIAIILSGVLTDYKESEKVPGELTASIEAIYKDSRLAGNPDVGARMLGHLKELTHTLKTNFERKDSWKLSEINNIIDQLDHDIQAFNENGTPIALVIKLRNELGNIKKISNRVEVIKETSFLPAGQGIAEFTGISVMVVMLLLKITPFYEALILIGVISLILTSVVLLIRDMDNPFDGYAKIDLRQIDKLLKYIDSREK
jgi:hypothetical protein